MAYIFGIHNDTNKLHTFNIPNVYDDGRICTGDSFNTANLIGTESKPIHHMNEVVTNAMKVIHTAPANRDLSYPEIDEMLMMWDSNFKTMHVNTSLIEHYAPDPRRFNSVMKNFFKEITNEQILDFSLCVNSTKR